jgi:hypothetical protein
MARILRGGGKTGRNIGNLRQGSHTCVHLGGDCVHSPCGRDMEEISGTFITTEVVWGRDESVRRGAGSQWIVAARPLCHLQCPVAYLSRLQRIQPTARGEGSFEAAGRGSSAGPA